MQACTVHAGPQGKYIVTNRCIQLSGWFIVSTGTRDECEAFIGESGAVNVRYAYLDPSEDPAETRRANRDIAAWIRKGGAK